MKLFKVLEDDELELINRVSEDGKWTDGSKSQSLSLLKNKINEQVGWNDPIFKDILPILNRVHSIPKVQSYTYLKQLIDPRLASYKSGGLYDWHADQTILANQRTDLSFTIFLSEATAYEGGELYIRTHYGANLKVKGEKGEMVVYPSGLLHKVNPVTEGERKVIVGWINSHVKSEEARQRLFEFKEMFLSLQSKLTRPEIDRFNTLYQQVVRDYSST